MIDNENKVVFVHIPKTGGESITWMIWNKIIPLKDGKHFTIEQYREKYDIQGYYCFSFVRNPYDKARSFYRYLMQHYSPHRINCSFREWVFDMYGEPKELFMPQVEFVDDTVEIFKFEDFKSSVQFLKQKIPFKRDYVHSNKSTKRIEAELTKEIKDKIYSLYKEDFKRFGYDK